MTDFRSEDFTHTATLLRSGREALVSATLSNNFNIILAALDAAAQLRAALLLTEIADLAHDECEECGGEIPAEQCGECFPAVDDARIARRAALGMPSIVDCEMEGARTLDQITSETSGGEFETISALAEACGLAKYPSNEDR